MNEERPGRLGFVGRLHELAVLRDAFAAADAAHGRLVLVAGDAGLGKTRLLERFREELDLEWVRFIKARCVPDTTRPYGPLLDVLGPGADAGAAAGSRRDHLEALTSGFLAGSTDATVVLVVEDVHWADAATLAALGHLLEHLDGARVLAIASYRPDALLAERPAMLALRRLVHDEHVVRIVLKPLADDEVRAFVDEALGDRRLPPESIDAVERVGEGNPFFIELLLNNALAGTGSAAAPEPLRLPPSAVSAVLELLRPLAAADRRILAQASVLGRAFHVDTLHAAFGTDSAQALAALRRARDAHLVTASGGGRFRFRHAVTREATYEDVPERIVRALHAAVATMLEATPEAARQVELLAHHWAAAGNALQAARYAEEAGDAAARVWAHEDAIAAYERAVAFVRSPSIAGARLLEKIARRHVMLGDNDASLTAWSQAVETWHELGDAEREAESRVRVAQQRYRLGDAYPGAPLKTMLARLGPEDHAARNRLHVGIAHVAAMRYRTSEAAQHLERVDQLAIRRDPDLRYTYYATRAMIAYFDADVTRFVAAFEPWLTASYSASDASLTALVHYNGGMYFSILGQHARAIFHFHRALAVANERADRMAEAAAHAMSAMALLAIGDLAGVRDAVDAVRAHPTDSEIAIAHAAAWGTLAAIHLGDERLVREWFDDRERTIPAIGAVIYAAGYAELLVRRGRAPEAQALLHRAIEYGDRPRGMVWTLLAVARFGAEQDLARARSRLVQAADVAFDVVERHAVALFDAYVAERTGDRERSRERAAEAAAGFARLDYPLLEATALELAGKDDEALALYRAMGALDDTRRLERTRRTA